MESFGVNYYFVSINLFHNFRHIGTIRSDIASNVTIASWKVDFGFGFQIYDVNCCLPIVIVSSCNK